MKYLKAVKLELEFLLLVEQLLKAVSENDVGIVKTTVLFVELVVLVDVLISCHNFVDYKVQDPYESTLHDPVLRGLSRVRIFLQTLVFV